MKNEIDELVKRYSIVNKHISDLQEEKRELVRMILDIVPYNPDGQKTISLATCKIRVEAGRSLRIDPIRAEEALNKFPNEMCPLRKKVTYELDKKIYNMLLAYPSYRDIADSFVIEVPKPIKIEVL